MERIAIRDLAVDVRRSPRRATVELSVDRGGRVILYAPEGVALDKLATMVQEKLLWIYQQLER